MQLPTWLGHVVISGGATLSTGDVETLKLKAEDNKIELCITDKEFLKDVIESAGSKGSIRSMLAQLKTIAGELKDEGLTVTLSYKGDRLVTIGLGAKPKFSRLATGTRAIEINSLRKLLELTI